MATENIIIRFRADGSRVVKREIQDIGDEARKQTSFVSQFRTALEALFTGLVVREVVQAAREFQNLERRILAVSGSAAEAAENLDLVRAVSEETGTSLSENAAVFARLSIATQQLGFNGRETAGILKTLNQALIIGGADATEASTALRQLGQALASGRLQGDELRAILESAPFLANELAKNLGVSLGQFRRLGSEGKLTSDVLARSLQAVAEPINQRFNQLPESFDQSLTRLKNTIVDFGQNLQPALLSLTTLINGLSIASKEVSRLVGEGRRLSSLGGEIASNATESEDARFRREVSRIGVTTGQIVPGATAEADFAELSRRFKESGFRAEDVRNLIKELESSNQFNQQGANYVDQIIRLQSEATKIVTSGVLAVVTENLQPGDLRTEMEEVLTKNTNLQVRAITGALLNFEQGRTSGNAEVSSFIADLLGTPADVGFVEQSLIPFLDRAKTKFQELATAGSGKLLDGLKALGEGSKELALNLAGTNLINQLKAEEEAISASTVERETAIIVKRFEDEINRDLAEGTFELTAAQVDAVKAQVFANQVAAERAQILASLGPSEEEQRIRFEALTLVAQELGITIEELNRLLGESSAQAPEVFGFLDGVRERFNQIDTSARALGVSIADAVVGSVDSAAGALADFAVNGFKDVESLREAFSNLFIDLGKQILQIIIQTLILKSIQAALGGGVASAPTPQANFINPEILFPGRQHGGPVFPGQPVRINEVPGRAPEVFVPTRSGNVVQGDKIEGEKKTDVKVFFLRDPSELEDALQTSPEIRATILDLIRTESR